MLGKDPSDVAIDRLLDTQLARFEEGLQWSLGQTVQQTGFLDLLMHRILDWWTGGLVHWVQVERHDTDSVGELLDVLARRVQVVVVVQIRHGREEGLGTSLSVANDETLLARPFNFIHFNDGPSTLQYLANNLLVDAQRMFGGLAQKSLVRNDTNVGFLLLR